MRKTKRETPSQAATLNAFAECIRAVSEMLGLKSDLKGLGVLHESVLKKLWNGEIAKGKCDYNAKRLYAALKERADAHFNSAGGRTANKKALERLGSEQEFISLARSVATRCSVSLATPRGAVSGQAPRRSPSDATQVEFQAHPDDAPIGNTFAGADNNRALLDRAFIKMFDERSLSDHLAGVSFAEWMNNADEWERVILERKRWINVHPHDLYCRAMLLWSILKKGNPKQMFEVLAETGRWLASDLPDVSDVHGGYAAEILRQDIERIIDQIKKRSVPQDGAVQWHVEDTLVRAALLRSLKFQGQPSRVIEEFASFRHEMENQQVMQILLESTKEQRGDSWLEVAVQRVKEWVALDRKSALGRLVLLRFIGRQGIPDQMESAIEQSSYWLERNPSQTVVRWATIWLGGLAREGKLTTSLIDESQRWLQEEAPDDERLVRHGLLWLVGERGTSEQVQRAIENTSGWLESHLTDDFIRVAFLLFLIRRIRRRGTVGQREDAMATIRKWLSDSGDYYGLTSLALRFCESAAD